MPRPRHLSSAGRCQEFVDVAVFREELAKCSGNWGQVLQSNIGDARDSHAMARPLRLEFPGAVYHVTSRGNARQDIVADNREGKRGHSREGKTGTFYIS